MRKDYRKIGVMLLLLVLAAVSLGLLWSLSDPALGPPQTAVMVPERDAETVVQLPQLTELPKELEGALQSEPLNFFECRALRLETAEVKNNWQRRLGSDGDRFLRQGYSVDEITMALESFARGGIDDAMRWRTRRLYTANGGDLLNYNSRISPEYREFSALDSDTRAKLIASSWPTVADLVSLLDEKAVTDAELLAIFERIRNKNEPVYIPQIHSISLIDHALTHRRSALALAALDAGLEPSNDSYLANSLEWALVASVGAGDDKQQVAIFTELIEELHSRGLHARDRSVEYSLERFPEMMGFLGVPVVASMAGDRERFLKDKFAINFSSLLGGAWLDPKRDARRLVRELQQQLDDELRGELAISEYSHKRAECDELSASFKEQWAPAECYQVMMKVRARFDNDWDSMNSELHAIDPGLIDFRAGSRSALLPNQDAHFRAGLRALAAGEFTKGLESLTKVELSEAQRHSLFWRVLVSDPDTAFKLGEHGYLPSGVPSAGLFHGITVDMLKRVAKRGINLHASDQNGKTLIYYAAKHHDPELLTWLIDQNIPYHTQRLGKDPLHAALSIGYREVSSQRTIDTLQALKRLSPPIDEHHRRRMAVIRLKAPSMYEEILAVFSELEIDKDQALPEVRCH